MQASAFLSSVSRYQYNFVCVVCVLFLRKVGKIRHQASVALVVVCFSNTGGCCCVERVTVKDPMVELCMLLNSIVALVGQCAIHVAEDSTVHRQVIDDTNAVSADAGSPPGTGEVSSIGAKLPCCKSPNNSDTLMPL